MAVRDEEAKAVLELINSMPRTPTQEEIARAILGVFPSYWRDMCSPGAREFQGQYNQDHPARKIEVELHASDSEFWVEIRDAPPVSIWRKVDLNKLRASRNGSAFRSALREALAAYEQEASANKGNGK